MHHISGKPEDIHIFDERFFQSKLRSTRSCFELAMYCPQSLALNLDMVMTARQCSVQESCRDEAECVRYQRIFLWRKSIEARNARLAYCPFSSHGLFGPSFTSFSTTLLFLDLILSIVLAGSTIKDGTFSLVSWKKGSFSLSGRIDRIVDKMCFDYSELMR